MASASKILPSNISGEFFVDSTCINCDACRQIAPSFFEEIDDYSAVIRQPNDDSERKACLNALISCPSGSIGCLTAYNRDEIKKPFPLKIDENVYYCGFNSKKSYGANSYFIENEEGNWLIDSPRYSRYLENKFREKGGISYIFLSHRDDIADASKYAKIFNSKKIIHKTDSMVLKDAEIKIEGKDAVIFNENFTIIPTPGHTIGHMVLLYKNRYLFTGDHLSWDRDSNELHAYYYYCWYNWDEQIKSMQNLLNFDFNWILPGHGQRVEKSQSEIKNKLKQLIQDMNEFK